MRAVNLIPSEQRANAGSYVGRSSGAALILVGLVFGVAVLALLYGLADRQIAKEKGEVAKIESQTAAVRARTGRLVPYTTFVSMAEQRTKTVEQLVQARFDWSHALHELGRVLPADASLQTLDGTVGSASTSSRGSASATPASSTPPGSTPSMTLAGCATSQAEVAQTLQRLRLMDGVSEVRLQSATKSGSASSGKTSARCDVAFSIDVTFVALPATPIPSVVQTTPASTSSSSGAHAQQVSTTRGAGR